MSTYYLLELSFIIIVTLTGSKEEKKGTQLSFLLTQVTEIIKML